MQLSTLNEVEFAILGPLRVCRENTPIELRRGLPRKLLIALILGDGETVSSDRLIDILWGDDPPRNAANALQVQVSYLRKSFDLAGSNGSSPLETKPNGYALRVAGHELDARRFEDLVREARSLSGGDPERVLDLYDQALALWRGDALADVADAWFAQGDITRLTEQRWSALEARNDLLLEQGRHRDVAAILGQLVSEHPLRERFHEQLVLALYRSGRQADALRAFERARNVLIEELGLDPGPQLRRLESLVLAQDSTLDWVAPETTPHPAREFRPAIPVPTGTVPIPISPIIGRSSEISRALSLLDRNRLLTLTGPGGAGKSRLAIEIAAQLPTTDIWFVDLSSIARDDLVAAIVASALGIPSPAEESTAAAVALALERQQGLLVLDTCEHVLEGCAELAVHVLQRCPGIRILATSRRPLGITAEISWPVPPLALPRPGLLEPEHLLRYPAVALFVERAGAVRPDFELDESNAADITAICLSLDGLPLAIELAAARVDVLTPAAIGVRLQNRFDLLVGEGRGIAARQHTLRSAIDWSFELLDRDEREFFVRLGVFPSSFDLDAAGVIAGSNLEDPLRILSTLVRHSMVATAGDDRYRLLDTLRAYALDQVLVPADDELARRHAEYFAGRAEEAESRIVGHDQITWLSRLRPEIPNLRRAVQWAFETGDAELAARLVSSLGWFWTLEGMLDEAFDHLGRAASLSGLPPQIRGKVLWQQALLAASLGQLEGAQRAAAESVACSREVGDLGLLAYGLNALAVTQWAMGDLEAAGRTHDEAIAILENSDNSWLHAVCLALRARTAFDAGELDGSQRARQALFMARRAGDRHVIGLALEQIAVHALDEDRLDDAWRAAGEGLAMQEAVGYSEGTISALHILAKVSFAARDLASSEAHHRRALALATRIGHIPAECEALEGLTAIAIERGDYELAARSLAAATSERSLNQLPLRVPDERVVEAMRTRINDELERGAREPEPSVEGNGRGSPDRARATAKHVELDVPAERADGPDRGRGHQLVELVADAPVAAVGADHGSGQPSDIAG